MIAQAFGDQNELLYKLLYLNVICKYALWNNLENKLNEVYFFLSLYVCLSECVFVCVTACTMLTQLCLCVYMCVCTEYQYRKL